MNNIELAATAGFVNMQTLEVVEPVSPTGCAYIVVATKGFVQVLEGEAVRSVWQFPARARQGFTHQSNLTVPTGRQLGQALFSEMSADALCGAIAGA
ncbi:hypothetical protein [Kutzneria buriramensis]|uniref:hypothetical protein n=1 Tax=Kutzneria buriramensis TaxID=1045776 RepID=UPI0011C16EC0|nr:hypothetical protein [Kutzneria buriramensis]